MLATCGNQPAGGDGRLVLRQGDFQGKIQPASVWFPQGLAISPWVSRLAAIAGALGQIKIRAKIGIRDLPVTLITGGWQKLVLEQQAAVVGDRRGVWPVLEVPDRV